MAQCNNPKIINTANVDQFGFSVVFDPYGKKVTFDISELTIFSGGGQANISNVTFVLTDPLNEEHTLTIDPSNNELDGEITGLSQASLYFGMYNVVATLTEADASVYTITHDYNVCHDPRLTAQNYIATTGKGESCIDVNVDCGRAIMDIYNRANMKYAGMQPITELTSYNGTITYPDNYQEQVSFTFAPYQLNLANSITGMYQVSLLVTAYYDLGCEGKLAIQYRGKVNKDIQCGAAMCDLNCCWQEALEIVNKGGSAGAQMAEKMQLATYWYNAAMGQWFCGNNNDYEIEKVKEILNCDCKCQKAVLIQPRPITYAGKNLIGSCGTTITEDENGDYLFHSFVYQVSARPGDSKITTTTVQTNPCTKTTYIELDCNAIQECILEVIAGSDAVLQQWQNVLGISGCPCDGVTTSNEPTVVSVETATDDYGTLEPNYFVKNDVVTGVTYEDDSQVTGGTFAFTEYQDQVISQNGIVQTQGANITLPCSVCGESLAESEGQLITYVNTTCSCRKPHICDIETPKVPYSERYSIHYRFNPQFEDMPVVTSNEVINGVQYTIQKLIFADSYTSGANEGESYIRYIKFKTDTNGNTTFEETRTLFGAKKPVGGALTTYNNTAGDMVVFDRASSINIDHSEVVNGMPVLYFVTFGGAVCRAVRTNTGNCDERKNWTIYVIRDLQSANKRLFGMKKWYVDANGNQTFLIYNTTDTNITILTFSNTGSKNDDANWSYTTIGIDLVSDNGNFNVDLSEDRIFLFGNVGVTSNGDLRISQYSGTNSISDLTNSANYNTYPICSNDATGPTTYTDGPGGTATIYRPYWMQKITVSGEDRYYFGNSSPSTANNYQQWSYLRYFVYRGDDPVIPDSWEFITEIVTNTNSDTPYGDGSWVSGVSSNVNGLSLGMAYVEDLGWVSLGLNGARLFNFNTQDVTIITGQPSANADIDNTNEQMDTQFEYKLTC